MQHRAGDRIDPIGVAIRSAAAFAAGRGCGLRRLAAGDER